MSQFKFNYWKVRHKSREAGPVGGSLIMKDRLIPFDYDDPISTKLAYDSLGDAIGEIFKCKNGTFTYNAQDALNRPVFGFNIKSIEEAERVCREKLADAQAIKDSHDDPVVKLDYELARHDWYYHYSDDHGVWRAGEAHWSLIQGLVRSGKVPDDKIKELWAKYAPKDFKCPVE